MLRHTQPEPTELSALQVRAIQLWCDFGSFSFDDPRLLQRAGCEARSVAGRT
jgi:hypothetical protein